MRRDRMTSKMIGQHFDLAMVKDLNDKYLWSIVYRYFFRIMSLRIEDTSGMITSGYVEQQWDFFVKTGIMSFRKSDEHKVKALIAEMKHEIERDFAIF